MIQTLEAIVSETGKISLLEEIRLEKPQRALVTILDEEPKAAENSQKENLRAIFGKMKNANLFADIENPSEWQKKLRDEWE